MTSEKDVVITYTSGKYFVWTTEDVLFLRTKHRICGVAIGSLPRKPWQNNAFSLPVLLMPEEVRMCLTKGFAQVLECKEGYFKNKKKSQNTTEINEQKALIEEEQMKIFKRDRIKKSKLYYGRKKCKNAFGNSSLVTNNETLNENCKLFQENVPVKSTDESHNKETSESDDLLEITEEDKKYYDNSVRVHLPTACNIGSNLDHFNQKDILRDNEHVRFVVYKDLWERGYYVTSAEKFGGDFLVYIGDPFRYHSNFIVVILENDETLTSKQMIYYGRLGSSVKKTVSLASFRTDDNSVSYISLQWNSMK